MINKLTATSLYTIALVCFSPATFAENNLSNISDTKITPLTSEQVTQQHSSQFVVSQSSLSKPESTPSKSVTTDSNKSDFDNENVNWVPSEWYSPY